MLSAVFIWTCSIGRASETENGTSDEDYHRANLVIAESESVVKNERIDVLDVEFGKAHRVDLIVENRSNQPFKLISAAVSCSCAKIVLPEHAIKPGEFDRLTLYVAELKPRKLEEKIGIPIRCSGPVEELFLQFAFEMKHVAAFDRDHAIVGVPHDDFESNQIIHYVPIVLSDANQLPSCVVSTSPEIKFVDATLEQIEGAARLRIQFNDRDVSPDGESGFIALQSPYSPTAVDRLRLDITRAEPIGVVPSIVTLRWDEKSKVYRGQAKLIDRVATKSREIGKREMLTLQQSAVEEALGGAELRTQLDWLNHGVYHATFEFRTGRESIPETFRADLLLKKGGQDRTIKAPIQIQVVSK